jgi:predicted nucleic acid-binding protein
MITRSARLEATRRAHEQDKTLVVPTAGDWLLASRILYWLTRGRKKQAGGKLPQQRTGASQRIMLDALIAVSPRRVGATVVTNDYDDFKAIRYYCNFSLRRGSDYFGRGVGT